MNLLRPALLLLSLLWMGNAQAQLAALSYDRNASASVLASANAATGVLNTLGAGSSGRALGLGVNAFDPFAQLHYALGPNPADAGAAWLLYGYDVTSGAALPAVTLSDSGRVVGAVFEQSPARLLVLQLDASNQIALRELNTASGAVTDLNAGLANCCELLPNAIAYSNGAVHFVGRLSGALTARLYRFPVNGSAPTSVAIIDQFAALVTDQATQTVYGLTQAISGSDLTLRFVQVNVATGISTQIGVAVDDCCAVAPDVAAISGGALVAVVQREGASDYEFLSFDLLTGAASFSSAPIDPSHIVNGLFDSTKGLQPSTTTITLVTPSPSQLGQNYTVNVTVTASVAVSGTVNVSDGVGNACAIILPATSCLLPSTAAGNLTITAVYAGAPGLAGSGDTAPHTVNLATSTTTITSIAPAGNSTVGVAYQVNVSVTGFGTPTGTVAVDDGMGAMCSITLPATSCMLTSTTAGATTISANYSGDSSNTASGDTAAYTIARAPTLTSISAIVPVSSSTVGVAYTVNVSVSGGFGVLTGNVNVDDGTGGSCSFALPATSCMLTSTVAGAKTISAGYAGDSNNLPSGDSQAYLIDQALSTTLISSVVPAGSSTVGQAYTVNVAVSGFGPPTGTVAVDDGSGATCSIVLPATSCMLTSITVGAKTISAAYSGDSNNSASGDSSAYTITQQTSTTMINSVVPNPGALGLPYAVDVTVSGYLPSGTVVVDDGAGAMCSIVLPATSCNLTSTVAGPKTISAIYPGDLNNTASADSAAQTIDLAPSTTTITSIAPAGSSVVGVAYTVNVNVTGFATPTGDVNVDDGSGAMCSITLPTTSCMLTSTSAGPKTISASYAGDVNNLPSADTAAYTIDRASSSTMITSIAPPASSIVGVAYAVNASVTGFGTPTGDVAVDDGSGAICTITLPASSCMLTSTSAGPKTITAAYAGDSNNLASGDTAAYQIDPAVSTTSITAITPPGSSMVGQSYSVDVAVSGYGSLTGIVAVDDGAGVMCTITLPATSCALTSTVVGAKTISANYSGDANNLASADTQPYQIDQATSSTAIASVMPNPAIVGQPYAVNVTVSGFGPPTGTIAVDDGAGAMCSIVVPATSCNLSSTSTGPKTITASYPGDVNNLPSSDSELQAIDPAPSTTTISGIVPAGSGVVGVAYTVNVSVTGFGPPSGTVALDDGSGASCNIVLPATSCMLTSTSAGPKTITASYPGDSSNLPSSDTEAYSIARAPSTTTITSIAPPGSSVVGVAYSVNVSVSGFGTLTGDVAVDDGSGAICTITLPASSCMLTSTSAGPKTITAAYAGDGNNLPGNATQAYQIDRATSVTMVPSVVPNPPTAGMPYTVTATVSGYGTPSGTITADDGNGVSCTITLPATSCSLISVVAGPLNITASYSGDSNNLPSAGSLLVNALQAMTATTLSASPAPVIVGMPVQLSASVTQPGSIGVVLGGVVNFAEGGVPIAGCVGIPIVGGVALCNTSFSPAGERTVSASYGGDANNLDSIASLQLMVNRVPTTTTLSVLPSSAPINGLVTLSVLVQGGVPPLEGTVSITANGFAIPECQSLVLTAGMANCQFIALEANEFLLMATYSGDVDDDASSGTANLSVVALSIPVGGPWAMLLLALSLLLIAGRALPRS